MQNPNKQYALTAILGILEQTDLSRREIAEVFEQVHDDRRRIAKAVELLDELEGVPDDILHFAQERRRAVAAASAATFSLEELEPILEECPADEDPRVGRCCDHEPRW